VGPHRQIDYALDRAFDRQMSGGINGQLPVGKPAQFIWQQLADSLYGGGNGYGLVLRRMMECDISITPKGESSPALKIQQRRLYAHNAPAAANPMDLP